MRIKDVNGVCIIDIEKDSISAADLSELKTIFRGKASKRRIAIDMAKSVQINHDFLEFLQECAFKQKLSLFNITNDTFLMLFISRYDKYVNMYLDESDFLKERNGIVNRRFSVVKTA